MTRPRPDCSSLPLARWYWMCTAPGQVQACGQCLRNASRHGPPNAWAPHQRWGTTIVGADRRTCHDYMPGDPPRRTDR